MRGAVRERPRALAAVLVGPGAADGLAAGGRGRVLASFSRACYVSFPAGLVALVAPDVHPGPLHAILDAPPPAPRPGTEALLSDGRLRIGGWEVATAGAARWRGRMPSPSAVRRDTAAVARAAARAAGGSMLPQRVRPRVRARVREGDLAGAAEVLAGRGPGLTPAGDDVLAGLLFAHRLMHGPEAEAGLELIARRARTTVISEAFLLWSALGQAVGPAHELVEAAVAGDGRGAGDAATALERIGESSGADLALGLSWGMEAAGLAGA